MVKGPVMNFRSWAEGALQPTLSKVTPQSGPTRGGHAVDPGAHRNMSAFFAFRQYYDNVTSSDHW